MEGELRWSLAPEARLCVPIVSVRIGKPITVLVSGPLLGVYAHFLDGSSVPCRASDVSPCPICKHQKARWKGFLPSRLTSGAKRIVEITEGAYRAIVSLGLDPLQGQWLRLIRQGPNPNSPLLVSHEFSRSHSPEIQPFDAKPSVLHMWGLDRAIPELSDSQGQG